MNANRRQWALLAVFIVVLLVYLRYGEFSFGRGPFGVNSLSEIDAAGLEARLMEINTVNENVAPPKLDETTTARNLFQYGVHKPPPLPPPDPAEIERQRLAAERALREAEEAARRRKAAEEAARKAREEAAAKNKDAPDPQPKKPLEPAKAVKPPPPPVNFKFIGVLGPAASKIGVLMDGTEPILVKQGQILKEHFKILNIEIEWTDVGYVDPAYKDEKKRLHLGS